MIIKMIIKKLIIKMIIKKPSISLRSLLKIINTYKSINLYINSNKKLLKLPVIRKLL